MGTSFQVLCIPQCLEFRFQGLGFRFRLGGSGFRVQGLTFKIKGSGFSIKGRMIDDGRIDGAFLNFKIAFPESLLLQAISNGVQHKSGNSNLCVYIDM